MSETPEKKSWKRDLYESFRVLIISLAIVIPIRLFIAQPFVVRGASMEPNYHDGEYLVVDELSYKFEDIKRGDVIVLHYPLDTSEYFIKRVIGLPGETVIFRNDKVYIRKPGSDKEEEIKELYIPPGVLTDAQHTEYPVPEGSYFVLGDNREHSSDSRFWGLLEKRYVVGHVLLRLWPLSKIGIL